MQHIPRPGEIPTDMTEFRARFQGGVGDDGGGREPRPKLGCGWVAIIVFGVALLLWLLGGLLRMLYS